MEVQTFTIVAGSAACNARCPFCISKMTPPLGIKLREPKVNWENFRDACQLAKIAGVSTVLITSKGEPTLFPAQITKFLTVMEGFWFPIIEMQTNGIKIIEEPQTYSPYLDAWRSLKMKTIAISIVHYEPEKNREVYLPYKDAYIDLPALVKMIHEHALSVRLTCIAANDFIDSPEHVGNLLEFARRNKVEQLTLTPVNEPDKELSSNQEAWEWTAEHKLRESQWQNILDYVHARGAHIRTLSHGAKVFDVGGQNLCLNNCLSVQPDVEKLRNIIFFPDGHVYTYWQYPGSIIF